MTTERTEAEFEAMQVCPADDDGHCSCWWDGKACCRCKAPEDPDVCKRCGAWGCEDESCGKENAA